MSEKKRFEKNMYRSLKKGLLYLAVSIWFVPGIIFKLLNTTPTNDEGFVNGFIRLSHRISPDVVSIRGLIGAITDKNTGSLLTFSNVMGVVIAIIFMWAWLNIAAYYKDSDKMVKLAEQAKDEKIKQEL